MPNYPYAPGAAQQTQGTRLFGFGLPDSMNPMAQTSQAGQQQLANNRLNTSTPWASGTFANGQYSTGFGGALGGSAQNLSNQAAQNFNAPMDWSQFGQVGTGDQARDQAITGAYNQASSRLDPQWNQREQQERTMLANQGLDPSSEAAKNEMDSFSRNRNDAYSSAMNGAISQGTAAGDSAFRNNMLSRQQAISEALQQRGQPLSDMQQLNSLLGQPNYNQDNSTLQAQGMNNQQLQAQQQMNLERQKYADQQGADTAGGIFGGIAKGAATVAPFLPFLF